jgi:hypothetical protein
MENNWESVPREYADGTSFCGYVRSTFAELKEIFGEPYGKSGDGKVTAEWVIKFDTGEVACIYDYKEGRTPTGPHNWHIGGHTGNEVELVNKVVSNA